MDTNPKKSKTIQVRICLAWYRKLKLRAGKKTTSHLVRNLIHRVVGR